MFPIRDLNPARGLAIVTLAVIAANVIVFVVWQPHTTADAQIAFLYRWAAVACELVTRHPLEALALETGRCIAPSGADVLFPEKHLALSVLVSMFLHSNIVHIAGNMWFLWIFGDNVEEAFGAIGYIALYLVAGLAAAAGFTLLHPGSVTPMIGASGAIAGVLGAYLVLFPARPVLALSIIGVVPVPSAIFLGLWFVGQFGVADPGVAWEAHVAGFLAGAVVAMLLRGTRHTTRVMRR